MLTFELTINEQKICLAGTSEGTLSIILTSRGASDSYIVPEDERTKITAIALAKGVHVQWANGPVKLHSGDVITIRIGEDEVVDNPSAY